MDEPGFCINVLSVILGYTFAFIYGIFFSLRLIKRFVKNPFDHFWVVRDREDPPECLNDRAFGNHVYIKLKDVKLHYVEKGDKSKPLMLCLHGFPECWYSWRHQIIEFSSDYWVVAVDMRGYGESDKPSDKASYLIEHLVKDVKDLLTALGRERCTLVSHDWGAIVAWYLVLQQPHLVDAYVIMNSAHPLAFHKVLKRSREQFKMSWYVFFFQLPYLPELMCRMDDLAFLQDAILHGKSPSTISDGDIEAFKYIFGKPGAFTPPINWYRANFTLPSQYSLKDLGKTSNFPPGLMIYGKEDVYLCQEVQEESVKLVKNAQLVYIDNTNHFVQQDNPTAVNREMRKFLSQLKSEQ